MSTVHGAQSPCAHALLSRRGSLVVCDVCAARAEVPMCPKCKKFTTWIGRPPDLVCYKCETHVEGLRAVGMQAKASLLPSW